MKKIKLKVGEDIFDTFSFIRIPEDINYTKIYDGFSDNCTCLDITDFPDAARGWIFKDGSFVPAESGDGALTYFEQTGYNKEPDSSYFAFLSNNVIFTFIHIRDNSPKHDMYKAATATGIVVEVIEQA